MQWCNKPKYDIDTLILVIYYIFEKKERQLLISNYSVRSDTIEDEDAKRVHLFR